MKTRCMYCNAQNFGPSCPFSPHGKHVHPGDPKRCIYCGSFSVGPGCPFNPYGRNHVHGVEFNQMVRDSVENSITAGYLINKISMDVKDTEAFKLGLVDESGKRIKKPETVEEKAAYNSLDAYVFEIKRMLGNKLDLINGSLYLQQESTIALEDYAQVYEQELNFKKKFERLVAEFKEAVVEATQNGVSTNLVEKMILEAFKS